MGEQIANLLAQACVPKYQTDPSRWDISPQFVKAFLESGRVDPKEFWLKATSSEAEFRDYWNEYNGDIIDYDKLMTATALTALEFRRDGSRRDDEEVSRLKADFITFLRARWHRDEDGTMIFKPGSGGTFPGSDSEEPSGTPITLPMNTHGDVP